MSQTKISECSTCGAPIWAPSVWHGITPPPISYSCFCNVKSAFQSTEVSNTFKIPQHVKTHHITPNVTDETKNVMDDFFNKFNEEKESELFLEIENKELKNKVENLERRISLLEEKINILFSKRKKEIIKD